MRDKIEIAVISAIIFIYAVLEMTLFDSETLFMLLSPNGQIPVGSIVHFFFFAFLRLLIYLALPLYVILRVTSEIIKRKRVATESTEEQLDPLD